MTGNRSIIWVLWALLLISCGGSDSTGTNPGESTSDKTPFTLSKVAGDLQDGFVTNPAADPLTVYVGDNKGDPLSGVEVYFTVIAGNATVESSPTLSDPDGIASAQVTFGAIPSEILIRVRTNSSTPGTSLEVVFGLRSIPRLIPTLAMETPLSNHQKAPVATPLPIPLSVIAYNDQGQPATGEEIEFRVVQGGSDAQIDSPRFTGADGIASALLTLGTQVGEVRVSATWTNAPGPGSPPSVSFTANALAGDPATLRFISGHILSKEAACSAEGNYFPKTFVVRLTDLYENPIPGRSLLIQPTTVAIEGYSLNQPVIQPTNAKGEISFRAKAGHFSVGYLRNGYIHVSLEDAFYPDVQTQAKVRITEDAYAFLLTPTYSYGRDSGSDEYSLPVRIRVVHECYRPWSGTFIQFLFSQVTGLCPREVAGWPSYSTAGFAWTGSDGIASVKIPVRVRNFIFPVSTHFWAHMPSVNPPSEPHFFSGPPECQ